MKDETLRIVLPVIATLAGVIVTIAGQIAIGIFQRRHEWRKQYTDKRLETYAGFQMVISITREATESNKKAARLADDLKSILEARHDRAQAWTDELRGYVSEQLGTLGHQDNGQPVPEAMMISIRDYMSNLDAKYDIAGLEALKVEGSQLQQRYREAVKIASETRERAEAKVKDSQKALFSLDYIASRDVRKAALKLWVATNMDDPEGGAFGEASAGFSNAVRKELGVK
ncbi:hypothetical protein ACFY36_32955 [Actinoplanes sp. NPDC000266]